MHLVPGRRGLVAAAAAAGAGRNPPAVGPGPTA